MAANRAAAAAVRRARAGCGCSLERELEIAWQGVELQRYLAKPMYSIAMPGYATGLTPAWPALQNFRVWSQGADTARNNYRWWIDDTKPPFKTA